MERIKAIAFAILIMCSTIFVSTFFYLTPLSKEDVYTHMNQQVQDVFVSINLPVEDSILTQDEFNQSISSDTIKERVTALFNTIQGDSIYTYGEETISEVSSSVALIYEKEIQRIKQEDANDAISLIQLLSASACVLACAIFYIAYRKEKIKKAVRKESKKENAVQEEKPAENVNASEVDKKEETIPVQEEKKD